MPDNAAFYAIDQNLAPIVSESFGDLRSLRCNPRRHPNMKPRRKKATRWGSPGSPPAAIPARRAAISDATAASHGLAVNFPASVPEITAVGGTEFNEGNGNYWSASNGAHGGSALGYIPEMAWNDTVPVYVVETGHVSLGGDGRRRQHAFIRSRLGKSARAFPPTASGTCRISRWRRPNDHDPYNIITSGQSMPGGRHVGGDAGVRRDAGAAESAFGEERRRQHQRESCTD